MSLASFIDHTLLRQDATSAEIQKLCGEAKAWHFAAVCVPPTYVREAAGALTESGVNVAAVIGFPFGYHLPMVKAAEAEFAIMGGAAELDMVANIGAIKSGEWRLLETEVREVLEVVKLRGAKLKVIVESGILTSDELARCCELYSRFNIDFLKTSTGFAAAGATVDAVRTMRELLPSHIAVKASGGIRSWAFAKEPDSGRRHAHWLLRQHQDNGKKPGRKAGRKFEANALLLLIAGGCCFRRCFMPRLRIPLASSFMPTRAWRCYSSRNRRTAFTASKALSIHSAASGFRFTMGRIAARRSNARWISSAAIRMCAPISATLRPLSGSRSATLKPGAAAYEFYQEVSGIYNPCMVVPDIVEINTLRDGDN